MPKSKLSMKEQVGLCLGVLLFFSIALTIAGFAGSSQTRQKMAAFAADGATVTGTITDKYIHNVSRNWVYWLDVSFKATDGKIHRESTNVVNTIYDGLEIGGPVQVTYVKSNPAWFYVVGDTPTDRDISISEGMTTYSIIAGILLSIALVVLVMWNRSGTPPTVPVTDLSQSSLRPSQPRTGFGKRQSR